MNGFAARHVVLLGLVLSTACTGSEDTGAGRDLSPTVCGPAVISTTEPRLRDRGVVALDERSAPVAILGRHVYYAADGKLLRMPVDGAPTGEVVLDAAVKSLKAHGSRLCWMEPRRIACLEDGGGPAYEIANTRSFEGVDVPLPVELTRFDFDFDDRHVYWVAERRLRRAPLDRSVAANQVFALDLSEELSWFAVAGGRLVVRTTRSRDGTITLFTCRADACAAPTDRITRERPGFRPLAFDGRWLHAQQFPSVPDEQHRLRGDIVRIDLDSDAWTSELVASCVGEGPDVVAMDGSAAFFLTYGQEPESGPILSSVFAAPFDGAPMRRLFSGRGAIRVLAVSPSAVAWIDAAEARYTLHVLPR